MSKPPTWQSADGRIQLWLGDCRELVTQIGNVDSVVTDPPYPNIDKGFQDASIDFLSYLGCRQVIFWPANIDFPLPSCAVHIWHKPNGRSAHHYERIFERNGKTTFRVYKVAAILPNYVQFRIECENHPCQKPVKLILALVDLVSDKGDTVFDPFMGSGTTGIACIRTGRQFRGIEIDPKYFEIARERIERELRQLTMNFTP